MQDLSNLKKTAKDFFFLMLEETGRISTLNKVTIYSQASYLSQEEINVSVCWQQEGPN